MTNNLLISDNEMEFMYNVEDKIKKFKIYY